MRNRRRRDVVEAIVNPQEPVHEVARLFNVPQRTVCDWLEWFRAEGWEGLNEKKRSGRPRERNGAQIQWVYNCISLGHPQRSTSGHDLGFGARNPVVQDSGGRFGMNLISAVSPRGDRRFSVVGETMDSARFKLFLKQLHRDAGGGPILVVRR